MKLPDTMSGVVLTGHGGPEKLVWRDDIPVPRPGRGAVLVKVAAAGINNTDINTRIGWYAREVTSSTAEAEGAEVDAGGWAGALQFPRIQGGDLCGHVVALGEGASRLKLGARVISPNCLPRPRPDNPLHFIVIGSEIDGAFAQYCLMREDDLYDVTVAPLSDVELGAMPCAYGTAEGLVTKAGVQPAERVLVTGASGGVGMAAVQLCTLRGAHVTGVAAPSKADAVRQAGAVEVIGRDDPLPENTFHRVIDVVGGDRWADLLRALRPGGHYAASGAIAGPMVTGDLRDIYLKDLTLHGSTFQPVEVFARLVDVINAGRLKPLVSQTYPLQDIHAAQADFEAKRYPGKLVLIPPED
ncbi:alcohol dehydrogenase family protein [Jhaorihella thermophila]|uniref:Alcohol dehydrogenase n=1 Tax=Jhaorihella thermophila TaxID=488547 RepID=A0A1H5X9N0_9RHOB|nr:alcohol dehydrogenase family protein [Jhaorihella thermophila]SEG08474.1 alcohol dehydrogenase [Jhaorihella thermophila]